MMRVFLALLIFGFTMIPSAGKAQSDHVIVEVVIPWSADYSDYYYNLRVRMKSDQAYAHRSRIAFDDSADGIHRDFYKIYRWKEPNRNDSIIYVNCSISKSHANGEPMPYYSRTINLNEVSADTVRLNLPQLLPTDSLRQYFKAENKRIRKDFVKNDLKDDVSDFLTYWDGSLLYASYYQGHRSYFELMYGPAKVFWKMPHSPLLHSGPALGFEFNTRWQKDNFILGPKLGWQISTSIMNAGLHFVYYTDFDKGSLFLKPRIGINPLYSFLNISYAYSIPLTPDYFGERINRHQLCLNFMIPVKK